MHGLKLILACMQNAHSVWSMLSVPVQLNPDIVRDKWSNEEDSLLVQLVGELGHHWASIARCVEGRTDQQCMGRWRRHLDPTIKKVRRVRRNISPLADGCFKVPLKLRHLDSAMKTLQCWGFWTSQSGSAQAYNLLKPTDCDCQSHMCKIQHLQM